MPKVSIKTITPQMAVEFISRNPKNRKISSRIVNQYAEDFLNGEFKFNGETIKFNKKGQLIDGQHRLSALIKAQATADFVVVEDLDEDAINTVDIGRKRLLADFLDMSGQKNCTTLAAAIGILAVMEERGSESLNFKNKSPKVEVAEKLLNKHPRLKTSVEFAIRQVHKKMLQPGLMAVIHYITTQADEESAGKFWNEVMNGARITEKDATYMLRNKLQNCAINNVKLSPREVIEYFSKAWRLFINNKKVAKLQRDGIADFPTKD